MAFKKIVFAPDGRKYRHILGLSGGKDSSALAVYMKDKVPEMEYVFCDTEKELDETYQYLAKVRAYLNKPIHTLKHDYGAGFDNLLKGRRGFLPSPQARWCTQYLKIKPFEKFVGNDPVISYVGIRADEPHRKGYLSTKPNIVSCLPFVEDGIRRSDVLRLLEESGLGLPEYYKWRSRSGCFFCFFQQRREWVGLLENHPDLFQAAMQYEKVDPATGEGYTWIQGESLDQLRHPDRVKQIKAEYEIRMAREKKNRPHLSLAEVFSEDDDGVGNSSCLICHL